MIDVLVVDDSPVARALLEYILRSAPGIRVVGTASTGEEAIELARRLRPHVITMDIHMPNMDGFEATRRIMQLCPTPVVVVSGSASLEEAAWAFRAIEAGALAVVRRPLSPDHPDYQPTAAHFLRTVASMAEVKVVRRWPRPNQRGAATLAPVDAGGREAAQLIAIGASTGGPTVLQTILASLPAAFPLPIAIVQHMAPGFIEGFAEWLAQTCRLRVQVAKQGSMLLPGHVYLAPDHRHMTVSASAMVRLVEGSASDGLRPSVAALFDSVAEAYGSRAAGVLLTGMGIDGAAELKRLRDLGALTIAQDQASSAVYGMPAEAMRIGAARYTLNPAQIGSALTTLGRGAAPGEASE